MQTSSLTHKSTRSVCNSSKMLQNNVSLKSAYTHIECTFLSVKHLDIDFHCSGNVLTITAFKPQIRIIIDIVADLTELP